MSDPAFQQMPVDGFLSDLASAKPTPGGGTGAAVVAASGAALVQMLAELTIGKKRYADHQKLMEAVRDEATELRAQLLALADEDAAAYDRVSAVFSMPKETDADKAARKEAMQTALKGACDVPLRVMESCLAVLGLAKNAVLSGNKNAISDGAAGAEFARSGLKVASYNVRINLVAIKDEEYVSQMTSRVDEMLYMGTAVAQEIDSHVMDQWRPQAGAKQG